jgi:hypothetical protein
MWGTWGGVGRLSFVALVVGVGLVVAPAIAQRATNPPPLPSCFKTGSGFGTCQGNVIPGGGTITKLAAPNAGEDRFMLTGPAPLQSTEPVVCNNGICLYHHLDWVLGAGASRVSGCLENQTRCLVRVSASPRWTPVYVRQDNEAPIVFALFDGRAIVELSGTVFEHKCVTERRQCGGQEPTPARDEAVEVQGSRKRYQEFSRDNGTWSVKVPTGNYTVYLKNRFADQIKPDVRHVHAEHDESKLDYSICDPPKGYRGDHFTCKSVAIEGHIFGSDGKPYAGLLAYVNCSSGQNYDHSETDDEGNVTLYAEAGTVAICLEDSVAGEVARERVNAESDTSFRDTVPTQIFVSRENSGTGFRVHITGLPLASPGNATYTVSLERDPPLETSTCVDRALSGATPLPRRDRGGAQDFTPTEDPGAVADHFCVGSYTITVTGENGFDYATKTGVRVVAAGS